MNATQVQKYSKYSEEWLYQKAKKVFQKWIRQRDSENGCISCPTGKVEHGGHFYSAGHYRSMTFVENNCNGQCIRCNTHLHANLIMYGRNLEKKIGADELAKLHLLADLSKRNRGRQYAFDKLTLIEIIERYGKK